MESKPKTAREQEFIDLGLVDQLSPTLF